jgi:guanylate kinase
MGSILRKNSSVEDKVDRLIAIEAELRNEDISDYVVSFDTCDQAVEQLKEILKI